jgi:putative nucleotidyltransferase with HDIG domain
LKPKHVLLVDDEDAIRSSLEKALVQEGFQVTTAPNGLLAQELSAVEEFDLVVSDIHMPGSRVSGLELLDYLKRKSQIPVILMTGFATLAQTKEAQAMGASAFLAKPFPRDELLRTARALAGVEEKRADAKASDEEFCKLSIDDFISGKRIQYNVFIRLSAGRYVKIAHAGEDLTLDRVRAYKGKGIGHLYLRREDFFQYLRSNIGIALVVRSSRTVSHEKKVNFLKHTGELILEKLHTGSVMPEALEDARTVLDATVALLCESPSTFQLLDSLNSHSDHLYAHSLGVSLYSALIARQVGWKTQATQFKVSMAGLLHDIGKKEIDRKLLETPRIELSPDQLRMLESHPARGMEILSRLDTIPSDVPLIVAHHHERDLGMGYPSGLTKGRIHPLARLVAVADEFCKLSIMNPDLSAPVDPREALRRLQVHYGKTLESSFMTALGQVLGR